MLRLSVSLALLSTLAAASPLNEPAKKAAVISLPPRSLVGHANTVFNAELALNDRDRVVRKYTNKQYSAPTSTSGADEKYVYEDPVDLNPRRRRRAGSGSVALKDDYDEGLDLRELTSESLVFLDELTKLFSMLVYYGALSRTLCSFGTRFGFHVC